MKSITIIDQEYKNWVKELSARYRQSQLKAAVKVNTEKLLFNYSLGHDIVEMHVEERWGDGVIMQLSKDLKTELPGVEGLSKSNIYYCKKFYLLYNEQIKFFQRPGGKLEGDTHAIFLIPWRHHCVIMDKVKNDVNKALFFVDKTLEKVCWYVSRKTTR